MGHREDLLAQARWAASTTFKRVRESSIYETEPVDFMDQPWFLNQILEIETDMTPEALLHWIRGLESRLGRQRQISKGPRTLDVDILLYDELVLTGGELELPHPRLVMRRHVLVPLAELAGDRRIPGDGRTPRQILGTLADPSEVRLHASS
jgi:2-amino-4-hydroxy-6-hydroxymethyldihydropteridine diphosphokinase